MLVGSEGTLGVIAEAKVKLQTIPKLKGVAAVHFSTIVEAAEGTVAALEHEPSAVELVDSVIVTRCRSNPAFRHLARWVEADPGGILIIEFYAEDETELQAKLDRLTTDLQRRKLGYATVATMDAALQRDMWRMREAGLGLIMSNRSDTKAIAYVEDTAVAPEKLPQFVARFQEIAGKHGTEAAYYGHASVGCLHIRPAVNVKSAEGLATMEAIANEVADLVLEIGGSLSGEHGDGILRGVFTEKMFGSQLTDAFREVKRAFDPDQILNPGKVFPKLHRCAELGRMHIHRGQTRFPDLPRF
jgi:FAD/FMN-containing dehydrogenase